MKNTLENFVYSDNNLQEYLSKKYIKEASQVFLVNTLTEHIDYLEYNHFFVKTSYFNFNNLNINLSSAILTKYVITELDSITYQIIVSINRNSSRYSPKIYSGHICHYESIIKQANQVVDEDLFLKIRTIYDLLRKYNNKFT